MAENLDDIINRARNYSKNIRQVAERLKEYAAEETPKANKEKMARFNRYTRQRAKEIFDAAVTDFYEDYTPKPGGYKRQGDTGTRKGGLYDVLAMDAESDLPFPADPPEYEALYNNSLPLDRKGGSLFDVVFKQGFHGGATKIHPESAVFWGPHPDEGVAYWRRPGFAINPKTEMREWHMWGRWYGSPAEAMDPSPYYLIAQNIRKADAPGGEFDVVYQKIRIEEATKLSEKLYEKLSRLRKEML